MALPQLHPFRPRLLDAVRGYSGTQLRADIAAGLTVGVVALPLAMAFAIASGVKPEQGIVTAIVAGFLISALGGSQVQIGGPAGAFIVIVYGIVQRYGLTNLLIATALSGVLLFAMGLLRLGALVRYIPVTIIIGFTNGIAVLIGLSQLKDLFGLKIAKLPADFFTQIGVLLEHASTFNPYALAIGLACLALVVVWPKSYTMPLDNIGWRHRAYRLAAHVPGTIVVLVLATLATAVLHLPVETIGSKFGGIPQSLPDLQLPPFSWESAKQLVFPTLTLAMLGAIESLLCARVADNLIDAPRHDPNQELMAQGVANMVAPAFGGIPATGTIARTVTNVRSGATSPVAGMVHSATLLVVVLAAAPLAANVPLAALAGILLFVSWNMGEWREFARLRHFSVPYRTIMLGTFFLTVVFDLTVAVEVGLMLACVFFIYRMSTLFRVEPPAAADAPAGVPAGVEIRELFGALFFGAVGKLEALPAQLPEGTRTLVLDLHRLISMDTSGLEALEQLRRVLAKRGITLRLAAVNEQPRSLMERAGFAAHVGEAAFSGTLAEALSASRAAGS
ncbi:MAG: STAS domain-containing protein [Piscinibacter sp.]|uniref:SulP family inorganic anion transporter n=1 Tax=Piscinibacter sp. TaxID=1903157 RepID=UPI0011D3EADB|nr:SulP family inorganic anion transporter [Piscinibacter sp.]MBP5988599.1 STAS domain-containing protein [Piscinibacter sp.]MBP6025912.1 STAS domain-containing protein [Piscinibacter sp.]TXH56407.1 MAG: STAS domain-containing protein [Burkholderiaceae bacterium]